MVSLILIVLLSVDPIPKIVQCLSISHLLSHYFSILVTGRCELRLCRWLINNFWSCVWGRQRLYRVFIRFIRVNDWITEEVVLCFI